MSPIKSKLDWSDHKFNLFIGKSKKHLLFGRRRAQCHALRRKYKYGGKKYYSRQQKLSLVRICECSTAKLSHTIEKITIRSFRTR